MSIFHDYPRLHCVRFKHCCRISNTHRITTSISANADGPRDAASHKIDLIVLHDPTSLFTVPRYGWPWWS